MVIEPVSQAIRVLERLHPSTLSFPVKLHFRGQSRALRRQGRARGGESVSQGPAGLAAWVSERQARDLVGTPLLQIHRGRGMT